MLQNLQQLFSEPLAFLDQSIFRILAVLIALCCHEWGHAFVSHLCGDDTARECGRMSLNPLAHLDPMGTLLMFFVGFGYARPVPVNPYRWRGDRTKCDLLVSLAGITVNLILFVLFTAIAAAFSLVLWKPEVIGVNGLYTMLSYRYNVAWLIMSGEAQSVFGRYIASAWALPIVRLASYTALINLNLALFNLLPLPPLDGYHVANDIIFKGRFQLSHQAFRIAMVLVLILSARGILGNITSMAINPLQDIVLLPIRALWG